MRRGPLLAALFFTALALRPQLVGIGPLIPSIQDAFGTSHAIAGLLGTIPVLCMGVFAPPAAFLSQRFGSRHALAFAVALIGVFGIARAASPNVTALLLLTFPVGVGMGIGNALMPVSVKERFADRPVFATGVYAAGINVGATVSAALAVPLSHALDSWRGPLVVFSIATLALVPLWLVMTRRDRVDPALIAPRPRMLPWRSSFAWRLVLAFFLMSGTYYGLNAWLPDIYVEHGWSESRAGALLAVLNAMQIVAGVTIAWIADRRGSRRAWLMGFATAQIIGLLGVILVPGAGWAWAALIGSTTGPLFSLTMTLPVDVGRSSADVAAFTGLMLGVGYSLSALSPLVLGGIRDATDGFGVVLWVLVGMSTGLLLVHTSLSPERIRRARLGHEPIQGST